MIHDVVDRERGEDEYYPPDLRHRNGSRVGQAGPSMLRIVTRRAEPERDRGDTHDHVPAHHDRVVDMTAFVDGVEEGGHPEGDHEHPDHLDQRRDTEEHVVVVVGGGQPRVVHPRPADREDTQDEPSDRGRPVPFLQEQRRLRRDRAEAHDEGEVEEQLKRGRGPVLLGRIAPRHACEPMGRAHA